MFITILAIILALAVGVSLYEALVCGTEEVRKSQFKRLSLHEAEEVKRYAQIFGLDNESISDNEALLEMGRKMEEDLGKERVDCLVELVRVHHGTSFVARPHKVNKLFNCMINSVIQVSKMIKRFTVVMFMPHTIGGDKDGESNIHTV
jgi:hypothetical protein